MQLMLRDGSNGPFLTQVIAKAQAEQQLDAANLDLLKSKAVLMSLKFADKFYNKYKMHLLEQAANDIIGVVSLGLRELADNDLDKALAILLAPESIIKPFQKGWSMLSAVSKNQQAKSLYVDVQQSLLQNISTPPDAEDWMGWQHYQQAMREHLHAEARQLLHKQFFIRTSYDEYEHFGLEDVLAEIVFYRALTSGDKVKHDLKQRLRNITLQPHWFNTHYFAMQAESVFAEMPQNIADAIKADLGPHFIPALVRTLEFAKSYQALALNDASPEKLDALESQHGLSNPLLGWPQYLDL
ncbi:hypothetical protein [Rheinheimera sp. MMS21-TC3]|uniref:cold adaptation protein AtcC n=1 Tax=Rheinheimera sp. MMS21-TC3 TaxID=3072790 RepID=UPI0028C47C55|nr:hypothetical protein [Rheinheimera sp. MMS21-TC3]WNO61301.1 hypothetical protein RDV63_10155 [Rheinheimera sp. MMS21-TC3]